MSLSVFTLHILTNSMEQYKYMVWMYISIFLDHNKKFKYSLVQPLHHLFPVTWTSVTAFAKTSVMWLRPLVENIWYSESRKPQALSFLNYVRVIQKVHYKIHLIFHYRLKVEATSLLPVEKTQSVKCSVI